MNVKRIPILAVAESLGISVTGKTASCLKNPDSTPSMKFDLDQCLFNCFSCGVGGSVVDLVMHAQGIDAATAIMWLKEHFDGGAPAKDFSPIYEAAVQLGGLQPVALDYLTVKRGISREVLDVAYFPKDLRASIVDTLLKKFPEAELVESGLYPKSEKSGRHYFAFFDCEYLFPYRQRGRVVHLQGRTENGAKRGKYIHLPGRPVPLVYGAHRIEGLPAGSEVYIAEGLFDALTLATLGLPAVGIPGAARLSKPEARASLARLLKDYVPIHIMQGDMAAESLAHDIATALPECRVLKPPSQYKDLNEWHVAIGGLTKEILDRNLLVVDVGPKPEEQPLEAYEEEQSEKARSKRVSLPHAIEGGVAHFTETGNAVRLVRLHGENIRYVHQWKQWLLWMDERWQEDTERRIVHMARDVAVQLHAEAAALPMRDETKATREALTRWAFQSERRQTIENALALASTDPAIALSVNRLDADPWRVGVLNGILNLRNGELEKPDREALILKRIPVAFDEHATCPLWFDFIGQATDGDAELQAYLQIVAGYCLTADTREQCFFLLHGPAGTGKTTFSETLQHILGDYALEVDSATLMDAGRGRRAGHQASPDVARLAGVRLAVAAETGNGNRLAASLIKSLTGGDRVSARRLYSENFDFSPVCKIFVYTNHLPRISDADDALWRRVRKIPFEHCFLGAGENKNFRATLKEQELPGILNWMIEGCLTWQREGLPLPEKVKTATSAYRQGEDQFHRFLEDATEKKKDAIVEAGRLYKAYRTWTEEQGEMAFAQKKFSTSLIEKGFLKTRKGTGNVYIGLELIHEDQDEKEPF